ncbi:phage terminase small subunit [Sphingobium sp. B11D3D]|uniref:phage terminase small subunit n=1 Tax=Sphingobium sp. B11D3D TaxID=2940576 RepID=UPI002225ABB6|nr:phage terminase small subunit [Sphingobium sp. B11D3D]MCW2370214.1 hypothetical protein [Sphingobium sp. B11D3D]
MAKRSFASLHRQRVAAQLAAEASQADASPSAEPVSVSPPPNFTAGLTAATPAAKGKPSLAAVHRQTVLAAQAANKAPVGLAAARPADGPAATEYELLLAALGTDIASLRQIQSVEAKIAKKAELIEAYDAHVDATLLAATESGQALQDEIVATMMIWRLDIGDFARGLDLAEHVLHFDLALPQNIVRQAPTLIAEEVAEAALKACQIDQSFDLDVVNRTIDLTSEKDMPDQVRAKLYKARGKLLLREAEAAKDNATAPAGAEQHAMVSALAAFQRALGLHENCGVKKDIERLTAKVQTAKD